MDLQAGRLKRSRSQVAKVFWFFFSKKNTLPSPTTTTPKFILALLAAATFATASHAGTVFDHVRAAGKLSCGAITEPGDDNKDDTHGNTEAFGEGICRAVAAAVFGNASKVTVYGFRDEAEGMAAVQSGHIALLVGATPNPALGRRYNVAFGTPVFYDGQGFLVRHDAGIANVADLAGKPVCFIGNTDAERSLHRVLDPRGIKFLPFPFEEVGEMEAALVTGHCRAETADVSKIASGRSGFHGQIHDFAVLPEQITLDPLSPVVAAGDAEWARVVDWTTYALIEAEILGITQANAKDQATTGTDAAKTVLGTLRGMGWGLGLPEGWGLKIIEGVGNYGEVFEKSLGMKSRVGLTRGRNLPWTQGGLLWAPPFRPG